MRHVVVTGLGVLSPAGAGAGALEAALRAALPLGEIEQVASVRGRTRPMRVARLAAFDRERHIPARTLRRMGDVSQIWTIACLLAREDAGLAGEGSSVHPPGRRGLFLGTGFGCIDATWDYLRQMLAEGMGVTSPFLFSESVANAPAGHGAIALDARGACITFTCGDASAHVAAGRAVEAIRQGRLDVAWAGGIEMMVPPLMRVLSALGVPGAGEGAVCLVLEEAGAARARGARVLAEVARAGMASDPGVSALQWSRDPDRLGDAMARAARPLDDEGEAPPRVTRIFLQGGPDAIASAAERAAAASLFPRAGQACAADVTGYFGAAGGNSLAAGLLALSGSAGSRAGDSVLISGPAWGGGITCLRLRAPRS